MPARHTDSASVWGFAIYPASQRVQEHGPLCGLAIGTPPPGVLECVCGLYSNDLSAHQQGEPPPES
jgi:hypothetical protein